MVLGFLTLLTHYLRAFYMFTDKQIFAEHLIYARYNPCTSIILLSSGTQSCPTLCDPMDCSTPGFPAHHQLRCSLKLMSVESVMPSNRLILCRPLLLPPSIFPSMKVFSKEAVLHSHQVAKVLELQLQHQSFQ